ncbi:MAG: hypothetical protein KJ795_11910 [Gammaproteobacteria bacterium]|nr:hypothetical protein [Gammaproteobacteria bacterium]MBU1968721.1 hypothetical protein [Gammaproteobacteria bacterium]
MKLIVIPAQAGIQSKEKPAKQSTPDDSLREDVEISWIPACAGMTVLMKMV